MLFPFFKVHIHVYTWIIRTPLLHIRFEKKKTSSVWNEITFIFHEIYFFLPAMIPYVMSATSRVCAKYVEAHPMKMKMPPMIMVSRQLNTLIKRLAIGPEWKKTRSINLEIDQHQPLTSPIHYFINWYLELTYNALYINIMCSEIGICFKNLILENSYI